MRFIDKVENMRGLYGKDIYSYSTKYIYDLRKGGSFYLQNSKGMLPGGIYQIKYDFGGIKQYKFILCLEVAKEKKNDKLIVACINIHDLTKEFRAFFFNKFFSVQIEKNELVDSANEEPPFNLSSNKNTIYQYLKAINSNYAIQLYNIFDISEIKRVSTNILDKVLFFKASEANSNFLKIILAKLSNTSLSQAEVKEKIKELIKRYDELLEKFDDSSVEYHKKLQYFERNIKIFEKP
jgi:hypothetical protein